MSGVEQRPAAIAADASPDMVTDVHTDAPTDATPAESTRAPLTSLSALLGGIGEGGAACAADGTCD